MPIFHDEDPFSAVKNFNDIVDLASGAGFQFMEFSVEDDRSPVVQEILGNFGNFDGFMDRLKQLQSIYCGKPSSAANTVVMDRIPWTVLSI